MLDGIAPYRKAFAYMLIGMAQVIINFQSDGGLTSAEIVHSVITGFGLFSVYLAEETPHAKGIKTAIAAFIAGAEGLVALMDLGEPLNSSAWLSALIAVAGILGVAVPSNRPENVKPGTNNTEPVQDLPRAA